MTFILELSLEGKPVNLFGPFKGRGEADEWVNKEGTPFNLYLPMESTDPPENSEEK